MNFRLNKYVYRSISLMTVIVVCDSALDEGVNPRHRYAATGSVFYQPTRDKP